MKLSTGRIVTERYLSIGYDDGRSYGRDGSESGWTLMFGHDGDIDIHGEYLEHGGEPKWTAAERKEVADYI